MIYLLFAAAMLAPLYLLWVTVQAHEARLKALEGRKPEPEKRVSIPTIQQLFPPVENFTPKKPETLRPNQVVGREVDDRSFEFDVKIKA